MRILSKAPLLLLMAILCLPLLFLGNTFKSKYLMYTNRGDRWEGIISPRPVSGDIVTLIGLDFSTKEGLPARGRRVYLHFPFTSEAQIVARVRDVRFNYWMRPKRNSFSQDQPFSWPRSVVLDELDIPNTSLMILATAPNAVTTSTGALYYPGYIGTESRSKPKYYRFRLRVHGDSELNGTIASRQQSSFNPIFHFTRTENYGGPVDLLWNGKDDTGNDVPLGEYQLTLEMRVFGTVEKNTTLRIRFQHYVMLEGS